MFRKAALDTLAYFAAMIASRAIALVVLPVYSRILEPFDYGILQFYSTAGMILGLLVTISLDAAIYLLFLQMPQEQFRTLLRTSLLYLLVVPPLSLASFLVLGGSWFGTQFPGIPWYPYALLSAGCSYCAAFSSIVVAYFRAGSRAGRFLVFSLMGAIIPIVGSLCYLLVENGGALSLMKGQFIGVSVVAVIAILILVRICMPVTTPRFEFRLLIMAFALSAPYLPHLLSVWVLNLSDRWVLVRYVPLEDIGIYGMAYTIGMSVILFGLAMMSTLGPIYVRGITEPLSRSVLRRFLNIYLFVAALGWLLVALFSREFFLIFTRPAYYGAANWAPWIGLGYFVFVAVHQPHQMVIEFRRRTWLILICSFPAAIVNVILNLILIPYLGVPAAILSTVGSFVAQATISVAISRRLDRLPYSWLRLSALTVICLTSFGVGKIWFGFADVWLALFAKSMLILVVAVCLAFVAGLPLHKYAVRTWVSLKLRFSPPAVNFIRTTEHQELT